ncbi:hypothetical protein [Brevibacillus brevis]|uniref:hypothetical protein n=1 Tax=Brevibacillus brevis TaxID=1393 RepID=UPI001477523B|nr:hypothetical protein [Brevibacillus brevis]
MIHTWSAVRQQIATEIEAIAQQVSDQNKELREQIEIVVTETRAERHRKKAFGNVSLANKTSGSDRFLQFAETGGRLGVVR